MPELEPCIFLIYSIIMTYCILYPAILWLLFQDNLGEGSSTVFIKQIIQLLSVWLPFIDIPHLLLTIVFRGSIFKCRLT